MKTRLDQIRKELNEKFIERRDIVEGMILALLSQHHVMLIGPPGTAKSMLANELCNRIINTNYFQWLLTKFSTPEEIFGPLDIKALENSHYKRITTGKLPSAHIAFLDEIWKANSAILNAMLTALNERLFHNDQKPEEIPLLTLVGASNEFPEGSELNALWDRFLLRYMTPYIRETSAFARMLSNGNGNGVKTTITLDELKLAQLEVKAMPVEKGFYDTIVEVREQLNQEGIIISDRRYKEAVTVAKAFAWVHGYDSTNMDCLEPLKDILWNTEESIPKVRKIILFKTNPYLVKVMEKREAADSIMTNYDEAVQTETDSIKITGIVIEAVAKINEISKEINVIVNQATSDGRMTLRVKEEGQIVIGYQDRLLKSNFSNMMDGYTKEN